MNILLYMKLTDFDYHLPQELIAQTPVEPRDSSRLLIVEKNTTALEDKRFYNIADILGENDVLVVNNTRVINARLRGWIKPPQSPLSSNNSSPDKGSLGGVEVEIFLHKQISDTTWDCLVYPGKKLKPGTKVYFIDPQSLSGNVSRESSGSQYSPLLEERGLGGEVKSISEKWRIVEFNIWGLDFLKIIEEIGHTPLPPYIKERLDDWERYQTVYNQVEWSSAAPTAWLHFTSELIEKLKKKGVKIEEVLLHVGLGTFANVETDDIEDHHMHKEYIELKEDTAKRLNSYKQSGKRIIAVGTTSIRVLETMSDESWQLHPGTTETDIFIYPWYTWKFVDSLITNFHLPKSTLMMLVSSLAGKETIEAAYKHAIREQYRFFSFWDAMWIK